MIKRLRFARKRKRMEKIFSLAKNNTVNVLKEHHDFHHALLTSLLVASIIIFLQILEAIFLYKGVEAMTLGVVFVILILLVSLIGYPRINPMWALELKERGLDKSEVKAMKFLDKYIPFPVQSPNITLFEPTFPR